MSKLRGVHPGGQEPGSWDAVSGEWSPRTRKVCDLGRGPEIRCSGLSSVRVGGGCRYYSGQQPQRLCFVENFQVLLENHQVLKLWGEKV